LPAVTMIASFSQNAGRRIRPGPGFAFSLPAVTMIASFSQNAGRRIRPDPGRFCTAGREEHSILNHQCRKTVRRVLRLDPWLKTGVPSTVIVAQPSKREMRLKGISTFRLKDLHDFKSV
jgi:hypothetical protein